MASAQDYANWIVANQDRKGSAEFETVATAYKQAKEAELQPVEEDEVETPKDDNSITGALKDTARLLASPAITGFNALGAGIGQKLAGGSFVKGLEEGAASDEFLGAKLSMDTTAGKYVEEKLGSALGTAREFSGDMAVGALKNKGVQAVMKGFGVPSLALEAYNAAPEDVKEKVDAMVYAGASAAPEIALVLLGGKGANKLTKKKDLTEDDVLASLEEPAVADGRQTSMTPIDYEPSLMEKTQGRSESSSTDPLNYEGGVDFYDEPLPAGSRLTPEEPQGLELAPKAGDLGLELVDEANARLDGQQEQLKNLGANLELEPIDKSTPAPKDNTIDFEQVDPNSLKETQQSLDLSNDSGMEFRTNATPEQGMDFIKQTLTDMTNPNKGEPAQLDLAGINKPAGQSGFGKGQRGSVSLFKPKQYTPEQKAKKLNLEEFTQDFYKRHPQYEGRPDVARQVYQRLNDDKIEKSYSIKEAIENSSTLKALDKGVGIVSTRIGNTSQPILHRMMRYEKNLLKETHTKIGRVDNFLNDLNKLPKSTQSLMNSLLLNNKTEALGAVARKLGKPELVVKYAEVRKVLDEVGADLKSIGRLEDLRGDYFPRIVTDVEGLKATLGSKMTSSLELRLDEARRTAARQGRDFGPIQESQIIDSFLRGNTSLRNKPGYTKERKVDEVAPDLEKFYATPTESLHTYLRNAVTEVETARLFGKDAIRDQGGRVDVEQSIGTLVQNKLRSGEITGKQANELESILKSRLGPGNQASHKIVQDAKNLANMGLLGNVFSTITQGGDVFASVFLNGLRPTLMSVVAQAAGKTKVNMKDFGLVDHISQEFVSNRSTAKALNGIFSATGFSKMDAFGKTTILDGAFRNGQALASTPKGRAQLASKWEKRFGDEFPQLIKDLQAGKVTELTDMYTFSTLAKVQPVTRLELPQKYLDMPNGRAIYMLKSFMLKQLDLYRNESYNKIKEGNVREGLSNMMKLSLTLGIGGATTQWIKEYILSAFDGREVDPELTDIPLNVLKTFGWSEYATGEATKGKVGETLGNIILPPYKMFDVLFADSIKELDGDDETTSSGKAWNFVPLVGKVLYQLSEQGQAARERRLQKEEDAE
jgi:hypothetical protein